MYRYVEDLYDDLEEVGFFFDEEDEADDPYPYVRETLAPEYRDLPPEEIEDFLANLGISAEDMEFSLKKAFHSVGNFVKKAAPAVLPIVGTAVGTAFGGPAGGAIGGMLGGAAGKAIGQTQAPRRPRLVRPRRPRPTATGGSPAAAQLLQLINRPEILQGLLAMATGRAGRSTVQAGRKSAPAGAIANLLGVLANQAAAEHHAIAAETGEGVPGYLLDDAGEFIVDPAVPEERAALLLNMLDQAAWEQASDAAMAYDSYDDDEAYDVAYELAMIRREEAFYDEMDLADLYDADDWED